MSNYNLFFCTDKYKIQATRSCKSLYSNLYHTTRIKYVSGESTNLNLVKQFLEINFHFSYPVFVQNMKFSASQILCIFPILTWKKIVQKWDCLLKLLLIIINSMKTLCTGVILISRRECLVAILGIILSKLCFSTTVDGLGTLF